MQTWKLAQTPWWCWHSLFKRQNIQKSVFSWWKQCMLWKRSRKRVTQQPWSSIWIWYEYLWSHVSGGDSSISSKSLILCYFYSWICPVTLTALCDGWDGNWITLQSNVLPVTRFLPIRCIDTVGADSRSSIVQTANSAPRRAKLAPLICVMYVMCEDKRRTVRAAH